MCATVGGKKWRRIELLLPFTSLLCEQNSRAESTVKDMQLFALLTCNITYSPE